MAAEAVRQMVGLQLGQTPKAQRLPAEHEAAVEVVLPPWAHAEAVGVAHLPPLSRPRLGQLAEAGVAAAPSS